MTEYGHVDAEFRNAWVLDHSPILIQLCQPPLTNPKPFKYIAQCAKASGIGSIVEGIYRKQIQGTRMFLLCQRLKAVKAGIKDLNTFMASYGQKLQ